MTRCPRCFEEVPANARFCLQCGERLPQMAADGDIVAIRSTVIKASQVTLGAEIEGGECPICGRHNARTATFRCKGCNRPLVCTIHQDPQLLLCSDCVAERLRRLSLVTIAPDGSGDLPTLTEAVLQCPPDATIRLLPGEYHLSNPLSISQPVILVGAGMEQTRIVSDAEGFLVRVAGSGKFSATGIAFVHEGNAWANVLEVKTDTVSILQCGFFDAVMLGEDGGCGILIEGNTRGRIDHCILKGNCVGVHLKEHALPMLSANSIYDSDHGILYHDASGGSALGNECHARHMGISIVGVGQPTLQGNVCSECFHGIYVQGTSNLVVRQNICTKNHYGITVISGAEVTIDSNQCDLNEVAGIEVHSTEKESVIRANHCSKNRYGILIVSDTNLILESNTCCSNEDGISLLGKVASQVIRNICSENQGYGIEVGPEGRPTLQGNTCHANEVGIGLLSPAGGLVSGNDCSDNRKQGIYVWEASQVALEANECRQNGESGIEFDHSVGKICRNDCSRNRGPGIAIGDSTSTVEANTCSDNGVVGIHCSRREMVTASGNRCFGNTYGDFWPEDLQK